MIPLALDRSLRTDLSASCLAGLDVSRERGRATPPARERLVRTGLSGAGV